MEVIATRISKLANFLFNSWEKSFSTQHSKQVDIYCLTTSNLGNYKSLNVLIKAIEMLWCHFHDVNPLMLVNFLKGLSLMFQYYLVAFCSASNNFWLSFLIANSCNKSTLTFFRSKNKKNVFAQIKVDSHQTYLLILSSINPKYSKIPLLIHC